MFISLPLFSKLEKLQVLSTIHPNNHLKNSHKIWVALHWHTWCHSLDTEERKAKLLSFQGQHLLWWRGYTGFPLHPRGKKKNKVPPVSCSLDLEMKEKWKLMVSATLRVLVFKGATFRYHFNKLSLLSAGVLRKAEGSPHMLGAALNIRSFPLNISHYLNAKRNVWTVQTEMWLPEGCLLLSHTTQLLVFPAQPQLFWLLCQHHRKWIIYTTYWI